MNKIVILDFGGQYCHLISRRIRDMGVFAEILPSDVSAKVLAADKDVKGIILSGGARSVFEKNAPKFDKKNLTLKVPVFGICYGHQLLAHMYGGKVVSSKGGEYGQTEMRVKDAKGILKNVSKVENVWMNHGDVVEKLPVSFYSLASTEKSIVAAFASDKEQIFGVQFHPEVSHTKNGDLVLENFVLDICKCKKSWTADLVLAGLIKETKETIKEDKAILGLSGGIDSSVAAELVGKAINSQLIAVYVDTGLMRHKETQFIKETFQKKKLKLKIVNAKKQFLDALKGVEDPEKKRKIIGKLFADIFYEIAKKEKADFLIQGTIYSDRIESGHTKHASKIKSHHNVGGIPKNLKIKIYEPLRDLYKDEVRAIAKELKLPVEITERQVFPGPGFAIRIVGEVTEPRVKIVRQATQIIEEELKGTKFWKDIWMSFAVLLSVKSIGIQGDKRSYKFPIVLRVIESRDAMTANFSRLPYELLEKISTRITNEVKEVNRVVYDITHKPPATMEWE